MITAICSLVFLVLGIWLGYLRSERKFGRMCDDGQLVWRYEDEDDHGWDGQPSAFTEIWEQMCLTNRR